MEGWLLYNHAEAGPIERSYALARWMAAAQERNITLKLCGTVSFDLLVREADRQTVILNDSRVTLPDFVLPRVGAAVSYFGLAMIRQLEQMGVYVCNCSSGLAMTRNKFRMIQLLSHHHIPIPRTMLVRFPVSMKRICTEIGFPLILKVVSGSEGFGVHLCETEHAFKEIMEIISSQIHQSPMIVQEFIKGSYGRDLRLFVLGGKVIACMERIAQRGFKANFSLGGKIRPYRMTPEIEYLACKTAELFELEVAGVDLLFDGDGFKVCEANSAPGLKGIEAASKMDIAGQVLDYIQQLVLRT